MNVWVYVTVCTLACLVLFITLGIMKYKDKLSYDFWPKFWLWFLGIALSIMVGLLIYDTYQTRIWMNANNCQKTSQSREYMYYMTVISGNTTIVVPQIGTEYLYTCDNNQTIWWYGE